MHAACSCKTRTHQCEDPKDPEAATHHEEPEGLEELDHGGSSAYVPMFEEDTSCDDPLRLSPKELGRRGEEAACELLRRKGYVILERNWTSPAGEADIIALDEDCIVFVEVKTRAGVDRGLPEEAVTHRKRVRYERIAGFFLSDYDGPGARVRFDVVGILALPGGRALARQVVNAFSAGG